MVCVVLQQKLSLVGKSFVSNSGQSEPVLKFSGGDISSNYTLVAERGMA